MGCADCGFCCVVDCCVMNCGICCVFDTSSSSSGCDYHPRENKTEVHARNNANELAEWKKGVSAANQKEEEKIIESINKNMNQFVEMLGKINEGTYGGKQLNINTEQIIRQNHALEQKVIGFIGRRMDDRLTLTDRELALILKEPDDKMRKKNFDDFVERVRKSAVRDLIQTIEDTVKEQSDAIDREIRSRLHEVNSGMEEEMQAYQELRELKEKRAEELVVRQSEYMFEQTLCDMILDEVDADRKNAV